MVIGWEQQEDKEALLERDLDEMVNGREVVEVVDVVRRGFVEFETCIVR